MARRRVLDRYFLLYSNLRIYVNSLIGLILSPRNQTSSTIWNTIQKIMSHIQSSAGHILSRPCICWITNPIGAIYKRVQVVVYPFLCQHMVMEENIEPEWRGGKDWMTVTTYGVVVNLEDALIKVAFPSHPVGQQQIFINMEKYYQDRPMNKHSHASGLHKIHPCLTTRLRCMHSHIESPHRWPMGI